MATEQVIPVGVWTWVGGTGVELRYDGPEAPTVTVDDQGAVVLPAFTEDDELSGRWVMRPGPVPVFRADQPIDLNDPQQWPGGYRLVDGRWTVV